MLDLILLVNPGWRSCTKTEIWMSLSRTTTFTKDYRPLSAQG
ncbi:hypothetical protein [Roseibium sp.]